MNSFPKKTYDETNFEQTLKQADLINTTVVVSFGKTEQANKTKLLKKSSSSVGDDKNANPVSDFFGKLFKKKENNNSSNSSSKKESSTLSNSSSNNNNRDDSLPKNVVTSSSIRTSSSNVSSVKDSGISKGNIHKLNL